MKRKRVVNRLTFLKEVARNNAKTAGTRMPNPGRYIQDYVVAGEDGEPKRFGTCDENLRLKHGARGHDRACWATYTIFEEGD